MEEKEEIKESPKKKKSGLFTLFACIMTGLIVFLAVNIGNMIEKWMYPEHYVVGNGSSDGNEDITIDLDVSTGAREISRYTVSEEGIVTVEERKAGNCPKDAAGCYLRSVYYIKGVKEGTVTVTVIVEDASTKVEKRKAVYNITVDKDLKLNEKHEVTKATNNTSNSNTQPNEKLYEEAKTGVVIEYTSSKNFGTQEEVANYSYVKLYADKKLEWGKKNSATVSAKVLTDEEYNTIKTAAFTESFKKLGTDLTDNSVMDGNTVYVTLYYADGTTFKTGGSNPTNEKFKSITSKLDSYTESSN